MEYRIVEDFLYELHVVCNSTEDGDLYGVLDFGLFSGECSDDRCDLVDALDGSTSDHGRDVFGLFLSIPNYKA